MSTEDIALESLATGWSALRLCAPERVRQLEQSLLGQGQLTPLLGFRGELIEVIDGFKRLLAARRLGWSSLSVRMLEGSVADAKVAIAQANARSGMDDLEQAWLVRALHREDGLTQPEIGRRLGRHKSWVCRRLALAEQLEVSIEADIRLGLLSATAARELTRLPRCNQRAVTDVVIERALTSRQVAGLVDEVLRSDTDNLGRVLSNVGTRRTNIRPLRKTVCEKIVSDVSVITSASARLQARLHDRAFTSMDDTSSTIDGLKSLDLVLLTLRQSIHRFVHVEAQP